MKCPSCGLDFHFRPRDKTPAQFVLQPEVGEGYEGVVGDLCPRCRTPIILLKRVKKTGPGVKLVDIKLGDLTGEPQRNGYEIIHPRFPGRPPLRSEVPAPYRDAYSETCMVLEISPKASAALSRRLLQQFIQQELQISKKDLATEIQEVVAQNLLPVNLASDLDHIRTVGNWAAHPNPARQTGDIVEVEPGEAEYLADILEILLNSYFYDRARSAQMKANLAAKKQAHPPAPRHDGSHGGQARALVGSA